MSHPLMYLSPLALWCSSLFFHELMKFWMIELCPHVIIIIIQENEHTHYANCGLHETFGIFGSWYFYEEKGKFYYLTNILLTKLGRFGSVPRYCCFECKGKKESAFFLEELKIT